MKSSKTQGIVLHTVKYGESSLVVYMLTRHAGRQTYLVQGVRGAKSRTNKAALYQPMFLLEFEGIETRHSQMLRIKDLRTALTLNSLVYDIRKTTISLFMAEVVYRLVRESEANEALFDFVFHSVSALDAIDSGVANFHLWFLVKLSYFLGFYPANEYVAGAWFDIREGSFTAVEPEHKMNLTQSQAKILGDLMNVEVERLDDLKLSGDMRSDFLAALLNYFAYHFDAVHNIRSVEILREVF